MAYHLLFVCDTCGADEVLTHAVEWTTNSQGEAVLYEGNGKISGLANRIWCSECQSTALFPFVTLVPPADHAVVAYAEAQRLSKTGNEAGECPVCRTTMTWQLEGTLCRCGGVFRLVGEWEAAT